MAASVRGCWRITSIVFAVAGVALLLFAFFNTREINTERQHPLTIRESIVAAKNNWPWVILVIAFVFYWLGNSARTSVVVYFTQYNLGNKNFASVLNGLVLFQMVGMLIIPWLVKRFSKTHVLVFGFAIAAVGQILASFTTQSPIALAIVWSFASVGTGIAVSMPFAMLSDTVDYGEWKNGIRAAGFLTAIGSSFAIKLGSGLGGWAPAQIMAAAGYVANQAQSQASLNAIQFCFAFLPAIFFVIGALVTLPYLRYEKLETKIRSELVARGGKNTAEAAAHA